MPHGSGISAISHYKDRTTDGYTEGGGREEKGLVKVTCFRLLWSSTVAAARCSWGRRRSVCPLAVVPLALPNQGSCRMETFVLAT